MTKTNRTCITTAELAARIKHDTRTFRERLRDLALLEGTHCIRPFGGRRILCIRERIGQDMGPASAGAFPVDRRQAA